MTSATLRLIPRTAAAAALLVAAFVAAPSLRAQDSKQAAPAGGTQPAALVVTAEPVKGDGSPAALTAQDVQVRVAKDRVKVNDLIAAQGDRAGLQLFILIDDTCTTDLGSLLGDVRAFIASQPKTTTVGVGYMSNAITQIAQNFTEDKDAAAKAVRLPMGQLSSMDSPYLSLQDLIKRWPPSKIRREVIMITDGIDRLRNYGGGGGFGPRGSINSFSNQSGDVDSTSSIAQKSGVIVYGIYAQGVGSVGRNFWSANVGQMRHLADCGGDGRGIVHPRHAECRELRAVPEFDSAHAQQPVLPDLPGDAAEEGGSPSGEGHHGNCQRGNCQRQERARPRRRPPSSFSMECDARPPPGQRTKPS